MPPSPRSWPRVSSSLYYQDANAAIEWLGRAFGFEPRLIVEGDGGVVVHSELAFGDGLVMVSSASRAPWFQSPRSLEGVNTQSLLVYVDDVDGHCARARAARAIIATEPKTTDYGDEYWCDRVYEAVDLEGHHWWFSQRLRDGSAPRTGGVRIRESG